MRGNPAGYDLPGPPIEVSNSHIANTSFFIIYAPPIYYYLVKLISAIDVVKDSVLNVIER